MDFAKDFIKFVPACIIIAVLGILLEQVLVTDTWFRFVTVVLIFSKECKIVCVKSNCADLFYAPYWGKQLKGWISNGKT